VQFYDKLLGDLQSGLLKPGQRLSEASLAREYGVSRSPVREAVARLENDGLVQRDGQVISVRLRSVDEIVDIFRVRVFVEGAIAYDAAKRRQDMDLVRLTLALEAEAEADRDEESAVIAANRAFHDALADAAHNLTLQDVQQRLSAQIMSLSSTTLSYPGRWPEAHAEHGLMLDAVRDRDAEGAKSIAEKHMERVRDIRIEMYCREWTA
jgi:DNA-binding GntR family transcriptional regulator